MCPIKLAKYVLVRPNALEKLRITFPIYSLPKNVSFVYSIGTFVSYLHDH